MGLNNCHGSMPVTAHSLYVYMLWESSATIHRGRLGGPLPKWFTGETKAGESEKYDFTRLLVQFCLVLCKTIEARARISPLKWTLKWRLKVPESSPIRYQQGAPI